MARKNDLPRLSRREWFQLSAAGVAAFSTSGWLETFAADAARHPQRKKAVILLWMNGGPSQTDTFDLKPGHKNGGPFKEIATSVARPQDQRASAQAGQVRRQTRPSSAR